MCERGQGASAVAHLVSNLWRNRQHASPPPPPPQVLVYHDLLGMMQHPHHAKVTPKFCKQYSAVGAVIQEVGAGHAMCRRAQSPQPGSPLPAALCKGCCCLVFERVGVKHRPGALASSGP